MTEAEYWREVSRRWERPGSFVGSLCIKSPGRRDSTAFGLCQSAEDAPDAERAAERLEPFRSNNKHRPFWWPRTVGGSKCRATAAGFLAAMAEDDE